VAETAPESRKMAAGAHDATRCHQMRRGGGDPTAEVEEAERKPMGRKKRRQRRSSSYIRSLGRQRETSLTLKTCQYIMLSISFIFI
jgi:hypothetical protein